MQMVRLVYVLPLLFIFFSTNHLFAARTELISKATSGGSADGRSQDPSISSNARYIVFDSAASDLVTDKTTSYSDIFLYDRTTGSLTRINIPETDSEADGHSENAEISADGTVVAFSSSASNLLDSDTEWYRKI